MRSEILSSEQKKLLPIVKKFRDDFGLVGGTAIALHLGHRESIDFDLFTAADFDNIKIRRKILRNHPIDRVTFDEAGQLTFFLGEVKFTFFQFPYEISFSENFEDIARLPDLLTLAAMKAFALGHRAKWKDYIDLYFILKDHYSLEQINERARLLFKKEYNEKIFRVQLSYFDDINYTEQIIFRNDFLVSNEEVKRFLTVKSLGY